MQALLQGTLSVRKDLRQPRGFPEQRDISLPARRDTGSWAAYRFLTSILADPVDVGKVCAATSLIALIYPFNLLLRVIREKNYRLISFVVAGFTLPSGVCWFIYGIMLHDYYIMCPNLLAFFIAVAQIIVKKKYKAKYPILELVPETSTVGIESTSDGANKKS